MAIQVCCDRCGQLVNYDPCEHFYVDALCAKCLAADRAPQGASVRLFKPAPVQLEGQAFLGL